ncbi:nitrous oxide reductase family maturation protein NosD [Paraflavitalea sp. CAU 1676]|uniref:nitrous oxide reductase family maturation protein NosD n=1 Tax=Paraflavitalea sp. CAU 1676 TaxID=3032598 RepID=UPI0023DBF698|nr:nitrous oxide reductase family maturation protein NosD [Paraflavitalea sp. CAU 1676]MDF2192514.1 nitrous oxide reductase family maturation protein NosD [Paraflavitalea sp. CAU 1676]
MKNWLLISTMLMCQAANAGTIVVGGEKGLPSIKQGLALTKPGDTLLIKKGSWYVNNAIVDKKIVVQGEGWPVLHGADKYVILTVTGKGAVIRGLHFTNSGYSSMEERPALRIIDASEVVVEGNRFTHTYFGIHAANSHHFTIRNNTFQGVTRTEQTTGNGIHLWKCSHALIDGNTAAGHRDGIYFEFVTQSIVQNNRSHHNIRYGLHFMFSDNDSYTANAFHDNGAGVAVMFSKKVIMERNRFNNNWGPAAYGLLLKEISDSRILHNAFEQNTVGIYMEGANRIEVGYTSFRANGWAARVQASCAGNNFHHNNFHTNTFDIATNGTLVLNTFNGNYWDKYEGYDLNRDGVGDVPFHPVSLYSMLVERDPNSLLLLRSFMVGLLDKAEKAIPSLTPENLVDTLPFMKPIAL